MNLQKLKERLKMVEPFKTFQFFGIDNCLAQGTTPIVPLSVCVTPPHISFIIESGHVTSLLLRYSETYKKQLESAKKVTEAEEKKFAKKVMDEVHSELIKSEEEQAKQIALLSRMGRDFLIAKAVYGYYSDSEDKFKIVFTDDKEFADEFNEESKDELAVYIDLLTDIECLNVGLELISALPENEPANIPLVSEAANDNGKAEKGVTETVKADSLATFPRRTRGLAVEDVSERSGNEIGDTGEISPTI